MGSSAYHVILLCIRVTLKGEGHETSSLSNFDMSNITSSIVYACRNSSILVPLQWISLMGEGHGGNLGRSFSWHLLTLIMAIVCHSIYIHCTPPWRHTRSPPIHCRGIDSDCYSSLLNFSRRWIKWWSGWYHYWYHCWNSRTFSHSGRHCRGGIPNQKWVSI